MRQPVEEDHVRVTAVMREWWGGLGGDAGDVYRSALLPRLYFQHFTDTSYVLDLPDGRLGAFLVAFVSQSQPGGGYIHFVGVAPELRRQGVGAKLYTRCFEDMRGRGVLKLNAMTGIANERSVRFHTGLGFTLEPGPDGEPIHRDYDGPGWHAYKFVKHLT